LTDKLAKLEEIMEELADRINEVRAEVESQKREDKVVYDRYK
jgi:hypothetical protein